MAWLLSQMGLQKRTHYIQGHHIGINFKRNLGSRCWSASKYGIKFIKELACFLSLPLPLLWSFVALYSPFVFFNIFFLFLPGTASSHDCIQLHSFSWYCNEYLLILCCTIKLLLSFTVSISCYQGLYLTQVVHFSCSYYYSSLLPVAVITCLSRV